MTTQRPTSDTSSKQTDRQTQRSLWQRLVARLQGREDSEHEQVLIRIGIGLGAFVYILVAAQNALDSSLYLSSGFWIVSGNFVCGLGLLAHLLLNPGANPARRYLGMAVDMSALTLILLWGQGTTALFYPFYLWVTFGMGFRYGRTYLAVSAFLSIISFATVIALSPFWQAQLPLTLSLWAALFLLPAYASSLLLKLTLALNRAEEANRAKGRFLATMSHELRTPLHAIIGMSELMDVGQLDGEHRQMVTTIHGAGQTLLEMIEDILDVARSESGQIVGDADDFDLHVVLSTVRRLLHHQATGKGIDLHVEIDPRLPYRLRGVSRWLKQILINLIGNAIKFTEHGRITVRVAAEHLDTEQVDLRIEVDDTGIGIGAEALERIFDQFAQADESTTRRYGGTGLGLAIARQFAERMAGTLTATSQEGRGSCFAFRAPFARAQSEGRPALEGRVLIVSGTTKTDYSYLLASFGAVPVVARGWSDATRQVTSREPFQAILLVDPDIDPEQQGFWTALSDRGRSEPIDVIRIGGPPVASDWPCLAALPSEPAADRLYRVLHAALAAPLSIAGDRQHLPAKASAADHRRILVAEDNRVNQKVIEKMLHVGGHSVELVHNGEELLDRLEEQGEVFDLVLVDLNMPAMNGLDALKIHRIAAGPDHSPFVALTADATDESRQRCLDAGMAGYLTKPVDIQELLSLIDRLTSDRKTSADPPAGGKVLHHPRFSPASVLDMAYVDRLRDLDQGDNFFSGIIDDFLEDAATLVLDLEAASLAGDSVAFRDRAHALRSSAAHLGATGLYNVCAGWRDIGPDDLALCGTREIAKLRSEFDRLSKALSSLKAEHANRSNGPAGVEQRPT